MKIPKSYRGVRVEAIRDGGFFRWSGRFRNGVITINESRVDNRKELDETLRHEFQHFRDAKSHSLAWLFVENWLTFALLAAVLFLMLEKPVKLVALFAFVGLFALVGSFEARAYWKSKDLKGLWVNFLEWLLILVLMMACLLRYWGPQ